MSHEKKEEAEKAPEEEKAKPEEITPMDVPAMLKYFVSVLAGLAWQYMGLIVNPQTKTITKDLNQAKLAIDCIAFLVEKMEGTLNETEKRDFKGLLSDLQINFVQQSSK